MAHFHCGLSVWDRFSPLRHLPSSIRANISSLSDGMAITRPSFGCTVGGRGHLRALIIAPSGWRLRRWGGKKVPNSAAFHRAPQGGGLAERCRIGCYDSIVGKSDSPHGSKRGERGGAGSWLWPTEQLSPAHCLNTTADYPNAQIALSLNARRRRGRCGGGEEERERERERADRRKGGRVLERNAPLLVCFHNLSTK